MTSIQATSSQSTIRPADNGASLQFLPLEERLALAARDLPNAKAELKLNETDIAVAQSDTLSAELRRAVLGSSISSWNRAGYLTKVALLDRLGLIDQEAKAFLSNKANWIRSCEDRVTFKIHPKAISTATAQAFLETLGDHPDLKATRHGNVLFFESEKSTDWPYWGPEDPAYTSRSLNLAMQVITKEGAV